ncbi:MAG: DUF2569 family protein [Hydrogenophaga sp.]|uniref:DUF2569 family protein n=1 Tax=Hydrogenophaga sp. TaxID=1904254 RepID=UPI00263676C2|nr:DUF2569 family protein [Hydrogenophaga sp.]MDM7943994.1 DUF2569 family protein [Hydrogenophaga sp.]
MADKWIKVSDGEARQHELYGIRGWLLFNLIGTVLGALFSLAMMNAPFVRSGTTLNQLRIESPNFYIVYMVIGIGVIVPSTLYIWAMLSKWSNFRKVAILCLLVPYPIILLTALAYPSQGVLVQLLLNSAVWGGSAVVWVLYLQRSRRVRVTFEHTIRFDDPMLEEKLEGGKASGMSDSSGSKLSNTSTLPPSWTPGASVGRNGGFDDEISSDIELKAWEAALNEYEGPQRERGLYAKLYVENDGNESKVKTAYLKRRVEEISEVRNIRSVQEKSIEMAALAKNIDAAIESGKLSETEFGQRKLLNFIDGHLGFLHLNRYYVFNDVDALSLQLDAIDKDVAHQVTGAIIVRPLESTTDEVCLKERRYSQRRIGVVNYFLLNNGRVVYFSTGEFYAFENLSLLRSAVQKNDHLKLADSIYGMNFG